MVMKNSKESKEKKFPSNWVVIAAFLLAGLLFSERVDGTKVRYS
jgi:hypothetical protein